MHTTQSKWAICWSANEIILYYYPLTILSKTLAVKSRFLHGCIIWPLTISSTLSYTTLNLLCSTDTGCLSNITESFLWFQGHCTYNSFGLGWPSLCTLNGVVINFTCQLWLLSYLDKHYIWVYYIYEHVSREKWHELVDSKEQIVFRNLGCNLMST